MNGLWLEQGEDAERAVAERHEVAVFDVHRKKHDGPQLEHELVLDLLRQAPGPGSPAIRSFFELCRGERKTLVVSMYFDFAMVTKARRTVQRW